MHMIFNRNIDIAVKTTDATILRLDNISVLETTAKYATLMNKYTELTKSMAKGAARLIVRTGSRTSDSA